MKTIREFWFRWQDPTQQVVVPFVSEHLGHGHDPIWWVIAPFCLLAVFLVPKLRNRCRKGHHPHD